MTDELAEKRRGQSLTEVELETLVALVQSRYLSPDEIRRVLHIHLNTCKYRLEIIRAKWDLPNASAYELAREAMARGVVGPAGELGVPGFVAYAVATLPKGAISRGVRKWLEDAGWRFLADRKAEAAA